MPSASSIWPRSTARIAPTGGSGGARAGDDGRVVAVRVRGRGALVAADRAPLQRGRRVPRDRGQPGARSRDDRALPGPPRARDRGCSGRCWRCARRPGWSGRGGRGRRHEGARQRVRARDARLRADRARDLAEADAVDAAEDERYGERRGDELPAELSTRRAAAVAARSQEAGSKSGAPRRRGRSRARGRSGCTRRAGGWKRSSGSSGGRTRTMRPTARAG